MEKLRKIVSLGLLLLLPLLGGVCAISSNYVEVSASSETSTNVIYSSVPDMKSWVIIVIILVNLVGLVVLSYLLLFFAFNKWTKKGDKLIRVVELKRKNKKVKLMTTSFNIINRDETEVFDSKEETTKIE
ncbi:MAG: hypothetical protein J5955_00645 [Bacilli bacterium]|nr:hypothetical protein [Bacilli bacterium]